MELDTAQDVDIHFQHSASSEEPLQNSSVCFSPPIRELLNRLEVSSINSHCSICRKKIISKSKPFTCIKCARSLHLGCISHARKQNLEQFECQICNNASKCLKCSNFIFNSENNIKCSLCWRDIHSECYPFPLKLFDISRPYFMRIYGKVTATKKFICNGCRSKSHGFKMAEIVTVNERKYYFMRLKHPSAIHYTWKSQQQIDLQNESMDQEYSIADEFEPKIQNILSLHVPKQLEHLSARQILAWIKSRKNDFHSWARVMFLIKWEHTFKLTWQGQQILFLYPQLLTAFFLKLQINYILTFRQTDPEYILTSEMGKIFDKEKPLKQLLFMGSPAYEEEKNAKTVEIMQKIFTHYQKKMGQSLKSKKDDNTTKVSVLGFLINTIYFSQKNPHPIIILTRCDKIQWWKNQISRVCPYHVIMTFKCRSFTPQVAWNKQVLTINKKTGVYDFDILLVEVEYLKEIEMLSLKKVIQNSSFLIMDEYPSHVSKFLYIEAKIAKIKLGIKENEDTCSTHSLRLTNNVNSLSDTKQKSNSKGNLLESQNLKESHPNQANNLEQKKVGSNSSTPLASSDHIFIQPTLNRLRITLMNTAACADNKKMSLLDELQRAVYLRYIMAFGLNFQTYQQLAAGLQYLQGSFFDKWQFPKTETTLYQYTKQFVSIVYCHSQLEEEVSSQNQLKEHYLFGLDAKDILKRINLLFAMKKFYQSQVKRGKVEASPGFQMNQEGKEKNPEYLDLMICQAVLHRGYGRWESISEYPRVWESGAPPAPMREYICKKAVLNGITTSMFASFLKVRLGHISSILQVSMLAD